MALIPQKTRRTARRSLLAAALALLAQLFAWAWSPAMGVAATGDGGVAVICTAEGFKSVVLDENGEAADPSPFDMAAGHCPLCSLVQGLGVPPVQWAAPPPTVKAHEPAVLPGDQIAAGWFLATLQARGPPLQG